MKLRSFATAAAICAGIAAVAIGMAGPTGADPSRVPTDIAGSGSDTTQDVVGAIAENLGPAAPANLKVGSWDATPVHTDITPKASGCTNITRPNGSGEGVGALRRSLSGTAAVGNTASVAAGLTPHPITPGALCFDFARSSSGPGANASSSGLLQYIPFAKDAVTVSVGATTTGTDSTVIKGSFTTAQLQALYASGTPQTGSDGVTYDPNPADGTTGTAIHLLIPQAGSGTRTFFAGVVGINATTPPAWVHDTFTPTGGGTSQSVEEHDGTAVSLDHNALAPFSIAQWISQANGHNDRRNGAVVQSIDGQAAVVSGKINPAFPAAFTREVFNVIPFSATTATTSDLFKVFVATSGPFRLCGQTATITNYGFAPLTAHTCGQIDPALRAFAAGTF